MKKSYEKAQIEIFMFEKKDVLPASAGSTSDHDNAYVDFSSLFSFNDFYAS